jgi:hypothetical protein
MENTINVDDLGVSLFSETPIHVYMCGGAINLIQHPMATSSNI